MSEKLKIEKSIKSITKHIDSYKYPLQGVRIVYSGNLKKGKRKQKIRFHM
jgi:hypothetical protein